MDFSNLPPELVSQMPLVAVLLAVGVGDAVHTAQRYGSIGVAVKRSTGGLSVW